MFLPNAPIPYVTACVHACVCTGLCASAHHTPHFQIQKQNSVPGMGGAWCPRDLGELPGVTNSPNPPSHVLILMVMCPYALYIKYCISLTFLKHNFKSSKNRVSSSMNLHKVNQHEAEQGQPPAAPRPSQSPLSSGRCPHFSHQTTVLPLSELKM